MNKFAIIKNNLLTYVIEPDNNVDISTAAVVLQKMFDDSKVVLITKETGDPVLLNSEYINGKFYPPRPHQSWIINNNEWVAPVKYPSDNNLYYWNEESLSWEKYDLESIDFK